MNSILAELNSMCWSIQFDLERAKDLMCKTDLNQTYEAVSQYTKITYRTTLLEQAAICMNVPMVRLLLECGADPNFVDPEHEAESVLWNLQYPGRTQSESEIRLEVTKILLSNGASPRIKEDGEELISYVLFFVFHGRYDEDWEYRSRFLILLIAYGGTSEGYSYEIMDLFNRDEIEKYYFRLEFDVIQKRTVGCIYDSRNYKSVLIRQI